MVFIIIIGNGIGLVSINVNMMFVFEFTKLCAYSPLFPFLVVGIVASTGKARRDCTHCRGFRVILFMLPHC